MFSTEDTIAAVATPWGEGGIGVIRVSGTNAVKIVAEIYHSTTVAPASHRPGPILPFDHGSPPTQCGDDGRSVVTRDDEKHFLINAPTHTCHVGVIGVEDPIDQVVVTVFRAPHSYTGEDVVEISAHGSPFVLQKILNLCIRHGARLAGSGEFTQRAFLNGKMDLTQAEAVADLIRARTDKTQAAALAQMEGSLSRKVRELRDVLVPLLAHVEVGLDHSDEDHDFLSRATLVERSAEARRHIEDLLRSVRVSKILREGLRVALVGRPNVGKSSLLNALLKEERAIVTPIPGTTRDTLEEAVNWSGIPVVLTDTAGLRGRPQDVVERLGVDRTRRSLETADLVIGLFDGSEPLTEEDQQVINLCSSRPHMWVINKSDLPNSWQTLPSPEPSPASGGRGSPVAPPFPRNVWEGRAANDPPIEAAQPLQGVGRGWGEGANVAVAEKESLGPPPVVRVSAKTGSGLNTLIEAVTHFALGEKAQVGEAQWLLNSRHQAALERAKEALASATLAAQNEDYEECVALELQTALGALGEIIGETTTEDLLDQIFSKFCVGK
jgi:tRNA modification GTPase